MADWFVVGVGSNIEPATNLPAALARLREAVTVRGLSGVYETTPVGSRGTPNFLNAAVLVEADLAPAELKWRVLRPIESALGRLRGPDPNAPRPIDLDLVLWEGGGLLLPDDEIELPDPELTTAAHVAIPVAELQPEWMDPRSGRSLGDIAAAFATPFRSLELKGWGEVTEN